MATKKNILSEILSASPNFFAQFIFGFIVFLISSFMGASPILSVALGIIAGRALGWFTYANENSPQISETVTNDGIDSGLKYWLFFMFSCILLGYPAPISILFGGIAAVGGGWIISWWRSKEETRTQLPDDVVLEEDMELSNPRIKRKHTRKYTRRYRRSYGSFNFRFWQRDE
jgi:hypothetical protein